MKKLISISILFSLAHIILAQDCQGYFPVKKGTFMETKNYDAKGKLTGTNQQTILAVEPLPDGLSLKVKSDQFDNKDKLTFSQDLGMRCENGVFFLDMKNYLDPSAMGGMKDMEMSVSGLDLEFPNTMQVGQILNDAEITMKMMSGGMAMLTMSVKMTNRKVEALEDVTTPAGTFNCYKISYDMEVKSIIKMNLKATQWVARNVGAVKNEAYDKNGRLSSYSLLTQYHE